MVILGIGMGDIGSAAVMVDGEIVASMCEERFNQIKNYDTWPAVAIEECLKQAGVEAKDVDYVAWGGVDDYNPDMFLTHRYCGMSVEDMVREQDEFWYPSIYKGEQPEYLKLFGDRVDLEQFPGPKYLKAIAEEPSYEKRFAMLQDLRMRLPEIQLGITSDKYVHLNHHQCHAAYAYDAVPHDSDRMLVFTMDGFGDGENATVSIIDRDKIEKLYGTAEFTVGRLYRNCTLLLGMKMMEHEFKVMGLAPYSKPYHSDAPYAVYANTLQVDGLDVRFNERPTDSYFYFKDRLKSMRFDGIAGGLQRFLEDRLCDWFNNWMEHTGIRDVGYAGGVAMNVKANMSIMDRCSPNEFIVPGTASDESQAIGACYLLARQKGIATKPLANMFLGTEVTASEGRREADKHAGSGEYDITDAGDERVAGLLTQGKIIGRCAGRMEFGARALGNRSIMADPRNPGIVRVINDKIKARDFWMPFAPSILDERKEVYIEAHPGANYNYMSLGAETTIAGKEALAAALHPADDTCRPNVVRSDHNPGYHSLISAFERVSGVGGILNTSLNIHGYPIVRTGAEALDVLARTDLDGMVVGETLFMKKEN